jgi:hypothetical protein
MADRNVVRRMLSLLARIHRFPSPSLCTYFLDTAAALQPGRSAIATPFPANNFLLLRTSDRRLCRHPNMGLARLMLRPKIRASAPVHPYRDQGTVSTAASHCSYTDMICRHQENLKSTHGSRTRPSWSADQDNASGVDLDCGAFARGSKPSPCRSSNALVANSSLDSSATFDTLHAAIRRLSLSVEESGQKSIFH